MYVHKPLPTTYKEIFEAAGYHPTTVSLALSTSRDIGLTALAGRKGLYNFTQYGIDYCRNLTAKRVDECRSILKNLLLINPLWTDVIGFLKANERNPRDPTDLTIAIEKRLHKTWSSSMQKTVLDSLVSILEFADLVRLESGKIVSLVGPNEQTHPDDTNRHTPIQLPNSTISAALQSSTQSPRILMAVPANFFEFAEEGVYIKVRKDNRSISLAKDVLDLLSKTTSQWSQTTKEEEAPGKS